MTRLQVFASSLGILLVSALTSVFSQITAQEQNAATQGETIDVALARVESVALTKATNFWVAGELSAHTSCVLLYVRVPFAASFHSALGPPTAMVGDAIARSVLTPTVAEDVAVYLAPTLGNPVSDLILWFIPGAMLPNGKLPHQLKDGELSDLRDRLSREGNLLQRLSPSRIELIQEERSVAGFEYLANLAGDVVKTQLTTQEVKELP